MAGVCIASAALSSGWDGMCALLSAGGHLIHLSEPARAPERRGASGTSPQGSPAVQLGLSRRRKTGTSVEGSGAPAAPAVRIPHDQRCVHQPVRHSYPTVLTTESINGGDADVVDANVNVVNAMFAELLDGGGNRPDRAAQLLCGLLPDAGAGRRLRPVRVHRARTRGNRSLRPRGPGGHGCRRAPGPLQPHGGGLRRPVRHDVDTLPRRRQRLGRHGAWTPTAGATGSPTPCGGMEELDGEFESVLETEDIIALNAAWLRGPGGPAGPGRRGTRRPHCRAGGPDPRPRGAPGRAAAKTPCWARRSSSRSSASCATWPGTACRGSPWATPTTSTTARRTLAWHFTTDQGEFLMVEDDDEAFMLNPRTKEILAAVEFEEADFEEIDA